MSGKVYMTADQKSQLEADKVGSVVGSQVTSPSRKVASQKAASHAGSQLSSLSSPSRKAAGETKVAPLTKSPIPGRLKDVRTPEQRRIDFENHILYHKLNKVTASYSVEQLYRDESDRQKWISTSCKYPYVLGPSPNNPGRSPKKGASPSTRLAPIQSEIDRIKAALEEEEEQIADEENQGTSEVSRLPREEEEAELNSEGVPPSQPHDEEEAASLHAFSARKQPSATDPNSQKDATAATKKSTGPLEGTSPTKPAGTASYTRSPTKRKVTKRYTEEMLATGRPAAFGNGSDEKLPTKCVYRAQRIMQVGDEAPQVFLVEFHSDSVNLDVYAWRIGDEPIPENILTVARRNQAAPADEECAEFIYARELEAKEEQRQQEELREQPAQEHHQQEQQQEAAQTEEQQTAEEVEPKENVVASAFEQAIAALEAIADEEVAFLVKALNSAGGAAEETVAPIDQKPAATHEEAEYTAKAAHLTVKVVSATGLRAADSNIFSANSSDPFATVEIVTADGTVVHANSDLKLKTHHVSSNLNPEWNVSFEVPLDNSVLFENEIFTRVRIWDHDKTSGADFLGEAHLTVNLPKTKNGATKVSTGSPVVFSDVELKTNTAFEQDEATGTVTVEVTLNTTTDEEIPAAKEGSTHGEDVAEEQQPEEKFVLRDGVASATGLVLSSLAAVAGTDVAEWATTVDFYGSQVAALRSAVNQLPIVQGVNVDARQLLDLCFGEDPLPADDSDAQLLTAVGESAAVVEKLRAVARAIYDAVKVADETQQNSGEGEEVAGQRDSRVATANSAAVHGTATVSGRQLDLPAPVHLQLSAMAYAKLKVICLGSHSSMADRLVLLPRLRVKQAEEEEETTAAEEQSSEDKQPVEETVATPVKEEKEEEDEFEEDFETASETKDASQTGAETTSAEAEKPVEYEVDPDAPPRLLMKPTPESPSPYKNSLEMALSSPFTRLERVNDVHAKSKEVGEKQEELYQLRKQLTQKTKHEALTRKLQEQEERDAAEREAQKEEMARRRQELKEKQAKADEESARRRKEAGLDREKTEEEIAAEEEAESKRKQAAAEQKKKNKEIYERGKKKRQDEMIYQRKNMDDEKRAKQEEEEKMASKRAALMKPRHRKAPSEKYEEPYVEEELPKLFVDDADDEEVTAGKKKPVLPDIPAKSAKLVVKVVSASGIRTAGSSIFSPPTSDPYATVEIVDSENNLVQVNTDRYETHHIKKSVDPEWNVTFEVPLAAKALTADDIFARVRVWDRTSDDLLGEAHLTISMPKTKSGVINVHPDETVAYSGVALNSEAAPEKDAAVPSVTLEITSSASTEEPAVPVVAQKKKMVVAVDDSEEVEIAANKISCTVKVVSAEGLRAADVAIFSKAASDPYAVVEVVTKEEVSLMTGAPAKTKTVNKNLNPEWNETFTFDLKEEALLESEVFVRTRVFDHDSTSSDDFLGEAHFVVEIQKTREGATKVHSGDVLEYSNVPLMPNLKLENDEDSQPRGSVSVEVTLTATN